MKKQLNRGGMAVCLALPLLLLPAGCKDKENTSTEAPAASDRAMNADRSTNAGATDADNTGKNVRDRNNATLTPGDQGNSPADRDLTQKIRQMLVGGTNDFSMTAQNIKIITQNGKVTLRGPVKTDAEKTGIVAIAKTVAGEGNVDDQLEVKTNP